MGSFKSSIRDKETRGNNCRWRSFQSIPHYCHLKAPPGLFHLLIFLKAAPAGDTDVTSKNALYSWRSWQEDQQWKTHKSHISFVLPCMRRVSGRSFLLLPFRKKRDLVECEGGITLIIIIIIMPWSWGPKRSHPLLGFNESQWQMVFITCSWKRTRSSAGGKKLPSGRCLLIWGWKLINISKKC